MRLSLHLQCRGQMQQNICCQNTLSLQSYCYEFWNQLIGDTERKLLHGCSGIFVPLHCLANALFLLSVNNIRMSSQFSNVRSKLKQMFAKKNGFRWKILSRVSSKILQRLFISSKEKKTKAWLFLVSSSSGGKKSLPAVRTGLPHSPPTLAHGTNTEMNTHG